MEIAIFVCIALMVAVGVTTYYIGKKKCQVILKYTPAIASIVGLVFFYVKMHFVTYDVHAFEGIYDILIIILLLIFCVLSLLVAIFMEVNYYQKKKIKVRT